MKAQVHRIDEIVPRSSQPRFEIRSRTYRPGDTEIEIFQMPAPATPYIRTPLRIAGLRGSQPGTYRASRAPPPDAGRHPF